MRAIVVDRFGPPEGVSVAETTPPALRAGAVRIAVRACGVNFADRLMIAGTYQEKPPFPFVPGMEIAGEVTACGEGVAGLAPGLRVMAVPGHGGFAEEAVVDADRVYAMPEGMDFVTAAAFPVTYGTAHGALTWRFRLREGAKVAITGAGGGAGLAAVEVAAALGAEVIALAGSEEKLALAQAHGARHCIDYGKTDVVRALRAIAPGGIDVAFDTVGGLTALALLRCLAWEGKLVIIGFAGGEVPQIPANIALVKNVDVVGFFWGSYRQHDPARVRASFTELAQWHRAGRLRPHVQRVLPLEAAGEALGLLGARQVGGKIVLTT